MSARTTLVVHAPTPATAAAAFACDEPLDDRGRAWARSAAGALRRVDRVLHSPAPAARETVDLMGLAVPPPGGATPRDAVTPPRRGGSAHPAPDTAVDRAWRDWDLGRWAGRSLEDVVAREPDAAAAWLTDPATTVHGGEPLAGLVDRVEAALAELPEDGHTVVVTHAAVVRAAVLVVLGAPASGFWRIDVAPLTAAELRGTPGRWTIRETGRVLTSTP